MSIDERKRLAEVKEMIDGLYECAKREFGFDRDAKISFIVSEANAMNPLGKTGYYDPNADKIAIYVSGRHIKDIMRSLAHELVHHGQNCRGEFANSGATEEGYFSKDDHLYEMEREAYERGNCLFRRWEEGVKYGKK